VCRLKGFRRVATCYDRLAMNFLAAVCIKVRRKKSCRGLPLISTECRPKHLNTGCSEAIAGNI
jgi:hypothetical protein